MVLLQPLPEVPT